MYDYENGDFEGLRVALDAINLSLTLGSENINTDWQNWKDTFLAAVTNYIPTKQIKGKNPLPWTNGPTLNVIKKKESVWQKLKKSSSRYLRDKYSQLRAKVKCMLRESRDKYLGSVESDFKSNPKRFWSLLRQNSKSRSVPHRISMASGPSGRIKAEGPNAIASLFNRYFASVFTESSPEFEELNEIYDSNQTALTDLSLTNDEVRAVLLSLDVSKATGPDGIPARLLRETADVIAPSLCCLFNKSLSSGSIPTERKLANVVPVYKKEDREYTVNYRPISPLSIISKVLERCVLDNIKDQLYSIINDCQHGFVTAKSCITNLIESLDHIGSVLDKGGQVDTIYLDMSKVFDKVDHGLLITKLRGLGFGGMF